MNDYSNTVRNVLALYRWAHAPATDATIKMDWCTRFTQERARRFLRDGLMTRCNRGLAMKGRKWEPEYQISQRRDALKIADWFQRRIRLGTRRFETPELQARFGALAAEQWNDRF